MFGRACRSGGYIDRPSQANRQPPTVVDDRQRSSASVNVATASMGQEAARTCAMIVEPDCERLYIERMVPTVDDIRHAVAIPMARRGVVRAGIFGSFARGDATESSDIDFLVEFEQGRTLLDLSGLRLDLCETFGREVDVATLGSLHPQLRERVLRELVAIL